MSIWLRKWTEVQMSKRTLPVSAPVIFLLLVFLLGPAAILQGNNPLLWMLFVLIVIGLGAWFFTRSVLSGITIRRILPDHATVGQTFIIGYEISRPARWLPAFDVTIHERGPDFKAAIDSNRSCPAWILHVGPGQVVHGEAMALPVRRGRLSLVAMESRTGFPLGIVPRRRVLPLEQDVLVYPEVHRLRSDLVRAMAGVGAMGRQGADRHGTGLDYYGTRPIRTGDGMRDIAWKISARRNDLIAIERSRPSSPRLRVVLDLNRSTQDLQVSDDESVTARDLEERAISLAASVIRDAAGRGYEVGLIVHGLRVPVYQVRGGLRHVSRMLASLAELDLDQDRRSDTSLPERERAGLVMIHPDRVRTQLARRDAWHLTGRQLEDLIEKVEDEQLDETIVEETAA
ncbi:MAG: hypothetical protein CMJ39_04520 [Phycisphaerae bacterium]|nr:hypothetical protein [Phycisphaerae bacterium]